jgi:glycosyltransferase involved in cell wall biosynthesis
VSERSEAGTASEPLISVVTPVYNGERYLGECIESVLAQTYQNWEYIISDNRSTDRSGEIAERYAQRDPRVRVVRNDEYLEIIPNWNRALRQISAESKYCKVVHADDLLFPECLAEMVRLAEEHPSVGMVGSLQLRGAKVQLDDVIAYPVSVVPGREICRSTFLGGGFVFGTPTTVLIRADLIRARERFYNEENLHADTEACFDVLRESDFGFLHKVVTYTRPHPEAMGKTAARLNTFIAGRTILLTRYGRTYLSRDEYRRRLARHVVRYAQLLARSFFTGRLRDPRFRAVHQRSLRRLRQSVSLAEVTTGAALEVRDRLWKLVSSPFKRSHR